MKAWSPKWKSSKQPRKQRKYRIKAPLHARQKMIRAHLSKQLRKEYGKRSFGLRKGDEVIVTRGKHKKTAGKVTEVDMKSLKIFIDNVKTKKVSGQEIQVGIDPSNVMITKISLDDKKRIKALKRK
jgi:large subunit ribosomal protein L24